MSKKIETILVTGGCGYIGSVLVELLIANHYRVIILDNLRGKHCEEWINGLKNVVIINHDIRNLDKVECVMDDIDHIIHLAGVSDGKAGKKNPRKTHEINLVAFDALIRTAKKHNIKRFINMSTFGVYGYQYRDQITEEFAVDPQEPYSAAKAETEKIALSLNSEKFITVNIRAAMVYGLSTNMRYDLLVNNLIRKAIFDRELTIFGGNQKRPQIHIKDLTQYLLTMLQVDKSVISGQVFNLGNENIKISTLAKRIKQHLPFPIELKHEDGRADETSFMLSSEKIYNRLGCLHQHNISHAIYEIYNRTKTCQK